MSGHPDPSDRAEWNRWATFANDVSDALRAHPNAPRLLFSQRQAVTEALWAKGYRPSDEQVAALVERQHAARIAELEDRRP